MPEAPRPLTLQALYLYPIKSNRGVRVEEAELTQRGLRWDRRLMWVDLDGRFLSQREHPRLALLRPELKGGDLCVGSPAEIPPLRLPLEPEGGERIDVRVWGDLCEAEVVEGAGAWLRQSLGIEGCLVHMPERSERMVDPRYARGGDLVSFADGFPLLLASEASLSDLNARLDVPVPMERFRPNLVVDGTLPYAEDEWTELRAASGGLRFFPVKPCSRCVMVNVDPRTGEKGVEPLRTLASYRSREGRVLFAQNLLSEGEGRLRVGDRLAIAR